MNPPNTDDTLEPFIDAFLSKKRLLTPTPSQTPSEGTVKTSLDLTQVYSDIFCIFADPKMNSICPQLVSSFASFNYDKNPVFIGNKEKLKGMLNEIFKKFTYLENVLDYNEIVNNTVKVDYLRSIIKSRYADSFTVCDLKSIVFFAPQFYTFSSFNDKFVIKRNLSPVSGLFETKSHIPKREKGSMVSQAREKVFFNNLLKFEENSCYVEREVPLEGLPEFPIEIFNGDKGQLKFWVLSAERDKILDRYSEDLVWKSENEFSRNLSQTMIEKLIKIMKRKNLSAQLGKVEESKLKEKFKEKGKKYVNYVISYLLMTSRGVASIKEIALFLGKQRFMKGFKFKEEVLEEEIKMMMETDERVRLLDWKEKGFALKLVK